MHWWLADIAMLLALLDLADENVRTRHCRVRTFRIKTQPDTVWRLT